MIGFVTLAVAPSVPASTNAVVRVASLAPSLTEIICAIGASDCLVGRSSACHYPADVVKRVPVAGDFGIPILEALAKCAPDLVVTVDMEDQNSVQAIEHLGIRHASIPCRSLDDIPRAIRTIGKLLHREDSAEKLAGEFSGTLANLRQHQPTVRRRVFIEIWGDPLMTAGRKSFLNDLITLAGGVNIAGDVARDFFQIATESVLARDPEVVILLEPGKIDLSKRSGWERVSAVKSNRICRDLDRDLLEIPGPRVLQAVEALRRCLGTSEIVERASRPFSAESKMGGTPVPLTK